MVTDRKKKKQKRDKLDVESLTDMLVYEMDKKNRYRQNCEYVIDKKFRLKT